MNLRFGTCSHRPELVRAAGLFLSRCPRPLVPRVIATETATVERETEDQLFHRRSVQATASFTLCCQLCHNTEVVLVLQVVLEAPVGLQGRFRFTKDWTVAGTIQERQDATMPTVRWS